MTVVGGRNLKKAHMGSYAQLTDAFTLVHKKKRERKRRTALAPASHLLDYIVQDLAGVIIREDEGGVSRLLHLLDLWTP
jgi:hypothetical protein